MEILGYSERGLVNSLFYEIRYSQTNAILLNELLSLITLPKCEIKFQEGDASVLIEQSFSDFGSADVVIFVDNKRKRQSIFIEAKVKTYSRKEWKIKEEFEKFKKGSAENNLEPSNLFTQLYRKVRLMKVLQKQGLEGLSDRIDFPECDKKNKRSIGNNKIVWSATKKINTFKDEAYFVCLIPETKMNLNRFFNKELVEFEADDFIGWDVKNWGYLSWIDVLEFCRRNELSATLDVFKHNEGQIF